MITIPTLFRRDPATKLVIPEFDPSCRWVAEGRGCPTMKFDGWCCLRRDGVWYRRAMAKPGRPVPEGFEPVGEPDDKGRQPGWVAVGDGPGDRFHREAIRRQGAAGGDGTYELIGPAIKGNAEGTPYHTFIKHGALLLTRVPRDFEGLRDYLATQDIEGVVWHDADGRMAKLKTTDFGLTRGGIRPELTAKAGAS